MKTVETPWKMTKNSVICISLLSLSKETSQIDMPEHMKYSLLDNIGNVQKLFGEFCSVKTKSNVKYVAGYWSLECENSPRTLVCPKCKYWIWHEKCMTQRFKYYSIDVPDFKSKLWMCIDCTVANQRLKIVI